MIELIDHTGEMELRVTSPTLEGLYAEALLGLARECLDGDPGPPEERRPVELRSSGPDTLLADLLNEAVYLMDADGFVASGLEDTRVQGGSLRGTLAGRREPGARALVKAATYHGLSVRPADGGWEGRVVLDV
jgi:SHS2 domain-containing protein